MTGRRFFAVVLAVAVLAGTMPGAVAAVDASTPDSMAASTTDSTVASTSDTAAVCDGVSGSGNVVVATLASTGERVTGSERLYANVTLDLRLCSSQGLVTPYGDAWELQSSDGFEVLSASDRGPRVRLEPGYGTVEFPSKIRMKQVDSGLTVSEPVANAVNPAIGVDGRLYVSSAASVDEYRSLEGAFVGASNRTTSATTALAETTAALNGSGSGEFNATTANRTLERLDASVAELNASASSFRTFLFGVARDSQTPGVAVDALDAVEASETAQREEANEAVAAYDAALDARERSLASTIRNNLFVAIGLGVVLGGLAGGALPYLVANRTIGRKRIDSTADYNRYALWVPVGGGIALVCATVLGVVVTTGFSLFGVIL
ncbi:hypothetical protein [Halorubellus litoreus]|uniref:ABC transport system permease protein n=1 Tax=Halorubellus litoreus TaxID=755308 RepID=A0ABD5VIQ0_9EURY